MSDIMILFGVHEPMAWLAQALRDRPGMQDRPTLTVAFRWGTVVVQHPRCPSHAPLHANGRLTCVYGRPCFMDAPPETRQPHEFTRRLRERLDCESIDHVYKSLSGMFAMFTCTDDGVELITDPLGLMPIYASLHAQTGTQVVGTHSELVAQAAARALDFDPASLAELLLRGTIIFPYTTRKGMRELAPGAVHEWTIDEHGPSHRERTLWAPREPARWPTLRQCQARLRDALPRVFRDVTAGAECVATALSSGLDSRVALAAVPADKRKLALTFADHESHTVRVARRVAAAAGARHVTVWRRPDFYATLPARATALVGTELFAFAHGLCILDAGLSGQFDLLIGGFLREVTLGRASTHSTRKRIILEHLFPLSRQWFAPILRGNRKHETVRSHLIRAELLQEVAARRAAWRAQVAALRPRTADQWVELYPASRIAHMPYLWANARLYPYDEPFLHRSLLTLGAETPLVYKGLDWVFRPVVRRLWPATADDTGTAAPPALLGGRGTRVAGEAPALGPALCPPWASEDSWPDYGSFQRVSPAWHRLRSTLADSNAALDVLGPVLRDHPREALLAPKASQDAVFNYAIVQLALVCRRHTDATVWRDPVPLGR